MEHSRELRVQEWNVPTEIIVGTIRHVHDVNEALQAGADILTVPPTFFRQMAVHPETAEAAQQSISDFAKWLV